MRDDNFTRNDVELSFSDLVSKNLQTLFETKQLYQSITIDYSPVINLIEEKVKGVFLPLPASYLKSEESKVEQDRQKAEANEREQCPFIAYLQSIITSPWQFDTETQPLNMPRGKFQEGNAPFPCFRIPTIRVTCNFCEGVLPPHNSGFQGEKQLIYGPVIRNNKGQICQVFTFPFQCQNCKGEPIFYLIRREGLKFTITGRSQFPEVDILKSLLKEESRYFRDAIRGHMAGQTLAALFLLRVFVEQYMRRVTRTTEKIRGEELADKYSLLLPADFPPKFNSLKKVYEELSKCLHGADASAEQFVSSRKDIEDHFEMLKLLPLKTNGVGNP